MIVFGGNSGSRALNDRGGYDPWSNESISLIGYEYSYHTANWTGESMIVFGLSPGHVMQKDFKAIENKLYYLFQKK